MTQTGNGALAGLRVVEYAQGIAAPFAGKLLADYGADVVKVEPPQGDRLRRHGPFAGETPGPERSGPFFYLNTNKRGITLDLETPSGREIFGRLVQRADILIEDTPTDWLEGHGLSPESLRQNNSGLIVTSVTPFGRTGPYRNYRGDELVASHGSGMAFSGRSAKRGPGQPPLKMGGNQATFASGLSAAISTLAAVYGRRASGRGIDIDISMQDAAISANSLMIANYTYQMHVMGQPAYTPSAPIALVKCRDGWIWLQCSEEKHFRDFVEMMGSPDWADLDIFQDRFTRGTHWEALEPLILEWTMEHDKEEIFREAQARRIPHAPAYTFEELLKNTQLVARGFFQTVNHPFAGDVTMVSSPAKFSKTPWRAGRPPLLGEYNGEVLAEIAGEAMERTAPAGETPGRLPLTGVRVLDFSWVHAGPLACMTLAELGAEVIKIETNKRWDLTRRLPPMADQVNGMNRSGYYNSVNRGKRSCTLDLSTPEAIVLVKDLVRSADVVLENFSAGVMERLGLVLRHGVIAG